jgi:hypothetical protein
MCDLEPNENTSKILSFELIGILSDSSKKSFLSIKHDTIIEKEKLLKTFLSTTFAWIEENRTWEREIVFIINKTLKKKVDCKQTKESRDSFSHKSHMNLSSVRYFTAKIFSRNFPAIHRVESKLFRVLTVISQNCVIVTFHISNPQKELFRMKPLTFGSKHWTGFFSSNVNSFIRIETDSNLSPSGLNYLKINLKNFCFKLAHPKVSSSLTWVVREI